MRKAMLARVAVVLAALGVLLDGVAKPNGWPWP